MLLRILYDNIDLIFTKSTQREDKLPTSLPLFLQKVGEPYKPPAHRQQRDEHLITGAIVLTGGSIQIISSNEFLVESLSINLTRMTNISDLL